MFILLVHHADGALESRGSPRGSDRFLVHEDEDNGRIPDRVDPRGEPVRAALEPARGIANTLDGGV
jgi:hypothetical protein